MTKIKDLQNVNRVLGRKFGNTEIKPLSGLELQAVAEAEVKQIEPNLWAAPHNPQSKFATLLVSTKSNS